MNRAEVISTFRDFVKLTDLALDQIAVTSGAGLLMYGLRENCGDIDMAVSRAAMDKILQVKGPELIQNPGNVGVRCCKYYCFDMMDNLEPGAKPVIDGVPVVFLSDLYKLKTNLAATLGRQKDYDDIRAISQHTGRFHASAWLTSRC